jgi:branched-chain amino acid aminotransferase
MSNSHADRFQASWAYRNGQWSPLRELSWSVTDIGTVQGAMLVERLRTIGGRLFSVEEHLQRLQAGASALNIPWNDLTPQLETVCDELLKRNEHLLREETDVGLVILVSPGDSGIDRRSKLVPTVMAHLQPLPFSQLADWYRHGSRLRLSSVRNVPAECWSPQIKTRSRLQYYLADQQAPGEIAVLLNSRGLVTETSVANLLIVQGDGQLKSPPLDDILHGVSLAKVIALASSLNRTTLFEPMSPDELFQAKEILLTGTTGCLWSAVTVNGQPIAAGKPGPVCRQLQQAWQKSTGYEFVRA